eukprot:2210142-Rhodomonas_salina.2
MNASAFRAPVLRASPCFGTKCLWTRGISETGALSRSPASVVSCALPSICRSNRATLCSSSVLCTIFVERCTTCS